MSKTTTRFTLAATAFAVAAMLTACGGGGTTPGTASPSVATFSSGFAANDLTVEGGGYGGFSGGNLPACNANDSPSITDNCSEAGGGADIVGVNSITAATSKTYTYYQTKTTAPTGLYVGVYVQAPGLTTPISNSANTTGLQLNDQTQMNFTFNPNPEWFASSTKNFMVDMVLGRLYTLANNSPCHVELRKIVEPTSANATTYTIPLSSFAVVQSCEQTGMTVASALAASPISQINFKAVGGSYAVTDGTLTSGANLTETNTQYGPTLYPTTVAVTGPITFN